ncbi:hypothetical protein LT493_08640 [Streptomyces tricolor]|nr:hypothetical protein [Streptomyces tricolor]
MLRDADGRRGAYRAAKNAAELTAAAMREALDRGPDLIARAAAVRDRAERRGGAGAAGAARRGATGARRRGGAARRVRARGGCPRSSPRPRPGRGRTP